MNNLSLFTKINFDNIPSELRQLNQWVNWRLETRQGKKTKIPYNSKTGQLAKTNNSTTWSTFETAKKSFLNGANYSGIGLVFSKEDGNFGLDIDHCFENDPNKTALAQEILAKFQHTYCEISPSQTGLRIFGKGNPHRCGKGNGEYKWIELYNHRSPRYLTVTGHHVPESASQLADCQEALDWLHEKFFATPTPVMTNPLPATTNHLTVEITHAHDVIEHCRRAANASKFETLFNGGGTEDQSSGDLSLCLLMAFYSQDESILDTAFRMSRRVNLTNGKWDKKHTSTGETYGQLTLRKALNTVSKTYTSSRGVKNNVITNYLDEPSTSTDWTKELRYNSRGELKPIPYNLSLIFENDKEWQGVVRYNEFTQKLEKVKKPPYKNAELGQWSDFDDIDTVIWLNKYYDCYFKKPMVNETIISVARGQKFHPLKDYLNSLTWDGVSRIEDFCNDFLGTEKTNYTQMVSKVLFLSAVARIFQPGCKSDYVPILEGAQGIGKSSIIRNLLPNPDYFSDTIFNIGSKDAYLAMRGKWIVELAELDSMNKADADRAKAFFSSSIDTYREPYGKNVMDIPRQCIFIGTVNKDTYLKDETGNRRYLPIPCNSIDIQGVIETRNQLWAEAVHRFHQGEQWWPDNSIMEEMKEQQEARYDQDVWQPRIEQYLNTHSEVTIEEITTSSQCLNFEINQVDKRVEIRVGKILRSLGYSKHRARINGILKNVYRLIEKSTVYPVYQNKPDSVSSVSYH
jgi:predicted P-loop ATPase